MKGMVTDASDYEDRFMGPIRRAILYHLLAVRDQLDRYRGSFQLFGCDLMISKSAS
jgi:hypothetical protein